MLLVIADAQDRSATISQLSNDVVRASFQERISLLERRQLIRRDGAGYVLTEAGRRAATRIGRVQHTLHMGVSGLYWD
jgi:Mn-dependent DtxR family transcriptional regulator